MGGSQSTGASAPEARLPDASVAPPPLLDGIVRVKVPADKIQPFLTRSALFKSAPKDVITRVSGLLQGLECADGSEIVTAGKVNDGIGILYSGKAQVLLHSAGGVLAQDWELLPGQTFVDDGAHCESRSR